MLLKDGIDLAAGHLDTASQQARKDIGRVAYQARSVDNLQENLDYQGATGVTGRRQTDALELTTTNDLECRTGSIGIHIQEQLLYEYTADLLALHQIQKGVVNTHVQPGFQLLVRASRLGGFYQVRRRGL